MPPHPGAILLHLWAAGPPPEEAPPHPRYISGPPAIPPNDPAPDPTPGSINACSRPPAARPPSMHLSILGWGLGWGRWGGALAAQKCNAGGGVPPPEGVRVAHKCNKMAPGWGVTSAPLRRGDDGGRWGDAGGDDGGFLAIVATNRLELYDSVDHIKHVSPSVRCSVILFPFL